MSRDVENKCEPYGYLREASAPTDEHSMDCGVVDQDGELHVGAVSIDRVIQINLLTADVIARHWQRTRGGGA